jgi:endo-1,4-beta-xylanase
MRFTAALLLIAGALSAADPQIVYLWPQGAPGSEGKTGDEVVKIQPAGDHVISNVHKPSITVYLPSKESATGAGVILMPGGGHNSLWVDHEGHNVAKFLAERGIAGFVLKYRLAREQGSTYTIEGNALADAQKALAVVRERADEFRIDPKRIGVMGFSAGGEVAALVASRWENADQKPAFQALIYPAIPKDMRLSKDTPAAFLACGENDRQNISQGLPELYLAMKKAGASAELHVFSGVGHGFGLRDTLKGEVAGWPARFVEWMGVRGYLTPADLNSK